jgi:tetratricopeptide (TPR) repeat protein
VTEEREGEGWREPAEDDEAEPAEELEGSVRAVLERAHEMGDDGDFDGMAERLRAGLEDHPGDPFLNCWLGVAERELGLAGSAYRRFRACLDARPTDPHLLATAGNGVAAFDDPDALGALRTAALLAPDETLTRWLYGAYLTREGMLEEGLAELIAARDLDPEDATVRFELGIGLALGGRRAEAIDEIHRSIELDEGDGWAQIVLGLLLFEDDRAEEAAGVLDDGARLRPEDIEAQLLAALACAAVGREDLGLEMVERARQWAEGAEESAAWLAEQIGPAALRDRMMTRP